MAVLNVFGTSKSKKRHQDSKKAAEEESRKIREESIEIERRITQKSENLDVRLSQIEKDERSLAMGKEALIKKEEDLSNLRSNLVGKLDNISSLTKEEARKLILENLEKELNNEIAKRIKEAEENIRAQAEIKAKEILINAMAAGATDWVAEYTVSTVKLDSEEIKGRSEE